MSSLITTDTISVLSLKGQQTSGGDVETTINYHPAETNGELNTVIPGTAGSYRRRFDTTPVTIHDIRGHEDDFSLEKQGFQVYKHISSEKKFEEKDAIKNIMYPEIEELLKKA
jgi:hypothetical protein